MLVEPMLREKAWFKALPVTARRDATFGNILICFIVYFKSNQFDQFKEEEKQF